MEMPQGGAERAKKEAKRLLRLARENNGLIRISKLSEALDCVGAMRGFPDWNSYERSSRSRSPEEKAAGDAEPSRESFAENSGGWIGKRLPLLGDDRTQTTRVSIVCSPPGFGMLATLAEEIERMGREAGGQGHMAWIGPGPLPRAAKEALKAWGKVDVAGAENLAANALALPPGCRIPSRDKLDRIGEIVAWCARAGLSHEIGEPMPEKLEEGFFALGRLCALEAYRNCEARPKRAPNGKAWREESDRLALEGDWEAANLAGAKACPTLADALGAANAEGFGAAWRSLGFSWGMDAVASFALGLDRARSIFPEMFREPQVAAGGKTGALALTIPCHLDSRRSENSVRALWAMELARGSFAESEAWRAVPWGVDNETRPASEQPKESAALRRELAKREKAEERGVRQIALFMPELYGSEFAKKWWEREAREARKWGKGFLMTIPSPDFAKGAMLEYATTKALFGGGETAALQLGFSEESAESLRESPAWDDGAALILGWASTVHGMAEGLFRWSAGSPWEKETKLGDEDARLLERAKELWGAKEASERLALAFPRGSAKGAREDLCGGLPWELLDAEERLGIQEALLRKAREVSRPAGNSRKNQ